MNDLTFEVVEDSAEFFAPVSSDAIDGLIGQYQSFRARIDEVAQFIERPEVQSAVHYFLEGNRTEERGRMSLSLSAHQLFQREGAIGALNAAFWSKTLALTDVLDMMPQNRRDQWNEQIRNPLGIKARAQTWHDKRDGLPHAEWQVEPLPEFEDATVRATITSLLQMRAQFLAERVDGIFRGLSGEHVTNAPEAFGKRMIIAHVLSSYGTSDHSRTGLINDLRCVIAKFMGRDEPGYCASSMLIEGMKGNWGEWTVIDGGALKVRLYKKGTAHLEVHPDMAWRLNMVLANLYPLAIPAEFRQKPKRKPKEVGLIQRPLPFAVLDVLCDVKMARRKVKDSWPERYVDEPNTVALGFSDRGKVAADEARKVLEALGGSQHPENSSWYQFDYRPMSAIKQVCLSGCMPDDVSHQYYPTPDGLAQKVVDLADVAGRSTLEPSAGIGALADKAAAAGAQVICVEVSKLRSEVLLAKGHTVVTGDFLAVPLPEYERVVMNPPFDSGRWQAHLEKAASLVKPGGKLVAILPSGAKSKPVLGDEWACTWHGPFDNQFVGASVSVVILEAVRA